MKQQVSPVVAVVAILIVVGIAAFAVYRFTAGGAGSRAGEQPPGMPPDVAAEFQKRMGGATGPSGPTGPSATGGGMQGMPPGAAAEFQKRMGGATGPGTAPTAPR